MKFFSAVDTHADNKLNVAKALIMALGCPDESVEDVFMAISTKAIPDTPQECIDDVRRAIADIRR